MTADQRFDQLEPLVSQTLAVADRHTAQLKQISGAVNQLLEATGQLLEAGQVQSDNIQFVLRELSGARTELSELRQEVRMNLDELKHKTNGTQQNKSLTSTRIGDLENAVSVMGTQMTSPDAKMDRLLGLLSSK